MSPTKRHRLESEPGFAGYAPVKDDFRYLLVTPRERQWGLYVTAAGSQFIPPNTHFRTQGHSPEHDYAWQHGRVLREYSIVYGIRGQGEFESKLTGRVAVEAGDIIFLFPNTWHRYRPIESAGWDTHWVMFQGDLADQLCREGFLNPQSPVMNVGLDELILRPFTQLLDRTRSQPLGYQQLIAADTLAIIAGVQSAVLCRQTASHIEEVVRRAKAVIEAAEDPPSIDLLAEQLGLSRSHFYQVFKSCTGVSPYQYHLQLRMSRAKELLRGSAHSVKQIALALKFDSVYQFSKIFKKKTGMSPSQYRRG